MALRLARTVADDSADNSGETIKRMVLAPSNKQSHRPDQSDIIHEENRRKKLENDHTKQKIDLQKGMFEWVRSIVTTWIYFIIFLLLALISIRFGFSVYQTPEPILLSEKTLIALLVTTTANILGLPYVITKALFSDKAKHKNSSPSTE